MTSSLNSEEPGESSGYSELVEDFYFSVEDLGKRWSVEGQGVSLLQTEDITGGGVSNQPSRRSTPKPTANPISRNV